MTSKCVDRGRSTRMAFRAALLATLSVTSVGLMAGQASAYSSPGVYYGNACDTDRSWRVDGPGTAALLVKDRFSAGSSITVTPCAFDRDRDGRSAEAYLWVKQYYSGAWRTTGTMRVVVSQGVGYTRIGSMHTFYRTSGASHLALYLRSCQYDVPKDARSNCVTERVGSGSWNG